MDGHSDISPTSSYYNMSNDGNMPASVEIPDVSTGLNSRSSSFRHDSVGLQSSSVKTSLSFDSALSGQDQDAFEGGKTKRFRFARNSDLEDVMSFDRVTMSAGRLSELWCPDPYSRNQWMIPEVDVENKKMVVLHSWMYGSCGWMTFIEAEELHVLPTSLFTQCRYLFQSPCNARKLPPGLEGKVKMEHLSWYLSRSQKIRKVCRYQLVSTHSAIN